MIKTVEEKKWSREVQHTWHELNQGSCTKSNGSYLRLVESVYGPKKIQSICARYSLFLPKDLAKPLNASQVQQLHVGLQDVTQSDVDKLLKRLKTDSLTVREKEVLNRVLKRHLDAESTPTLAALKSAASGSNLPATLFNELVQAFLDTNFQIGKESLSLEKISGIPGKYFEHGWLSFKKGRNLEDRERLRIYDEIKTLGPKDQVRYSELLSKILVKKHPFQEKNNALKMDKLVPGLPGEDGEPRWYRISEIMDSGWGKCGYRLQPATTQYGADMPDIIFFRSSSTLPTAMDSFTSVINDVSIFPPGYLSQNRCKEQELRWLTEATEAPKGQRPLLITGHSLGASTSQLALINLQKSGKWIDRKISLELFDSPAISKKDAKAFADWYDKQDYNQPLTFHYYVSKKDLVPLAGALNGSSYLGNEIRKKNVIAEVHQLELTEEGKKKAELTGLGAHGRIFFRGIEGVDFIDHVVSIEEFDKKNRRARLAVNILKTVGAFLVWPTIGALGGLKRLFFGRRYHSPVILQLFNSFKSQRAS